MIYSKDFDLTFKDKSQMRQYLTEQLETVPNPLRDIVINDYVNRAKTTKKVIGGAPIRFN